MQHFRRRRILGRVWKRIAQFFRIIRNIALVVFLITILIYFGVAGWLYWEFSKRPTVKQDSVLVMQFEGYIQDRPTADPLSEKVVGSLGKTRRAMVDNIRKAAKDPRIIGILLELDSYGINVTTLTEIRDELLRFKESGKKIFAYMEWMSLRDCLLSSVADKIYMPPSGDLFFTSIRAEIPFFKGMFDKIGVTPEFVAIGKYKTAPQIFTQERMSDEYREVTNNMLDASYTYFISQIAQARDVPEETVKAWIDKGIFSASYALEDGLIDEALYKDQVEKTIQLELGLVEEEEEKSDAEEGEKSDSEGEEQDESEEKEDEPEELNKISHAQYVRVDVKAPNLHRKGEKIAVIYARGSIVSGDSEPPSSNSPTIGSDTMSALFEDLAEDEDIKGIILRVDSGGGGARASDIIRHAVIEAKKEKPVVVSMAGAAASGGYMISAPADSIVAYPLTITGSIGIFGGKFSMGGLLDLVGIHVEMIQRGENAGVFSSARTWTESEYEAISANIRQGYDEFIAHVAQGRGMSIEEVDTIAQGRVWMGERAHELGLVDKLGGMDTAIEVIKEKLEIPEDEDIKLVEYPKMDTPLEQLLRQLRGYPMQAELPKEIEQVQSYLKELVALQEEILFAWFPFRLVIE